MNGSYEDDVFYLEIRILHQDALHKHTKGKIHIYKIMTKSSVTLLIIF
jgi:hypothetical protein